ncbi:LysR substrate-binding domain-containing protein [Undibacterium sp. TJN19]|uniref:LysR family transcriptional regulator n=1 Tax=Undibacterium sp. TJN19 TaxID=3413055 RepID=UPI003BF2DD58
MQFDHLRRMALFAQVVRYGSFTAAAGAQNVATSVLSAAVSQLEDELGVRLLHRTTRRISLTEVGQSFYEKCVDMLASADAAQEAIAAHSGEIVGRLRITAASDMAENIILPALTPLARIHPRLLLDIQVADQIVDMAAQQIDLSIRSGWMRDSSLVARKLADLHEVLVASPAYLKQAGVPASPDDLRHHRIIGLTRFTDPTTLILKHQNGTSAKINLTPAAMTDSVRMLSEMAMTGYGLARMLAYTAAPALRDGTLVTVLKDWQLPGAGFYAVTLKRELQPQKVNAAIKALADFLAKTTSRQQCR